MGGVWALFFLDQPPLLALQSPIQPSAGRPALSPLSQWMVRFAQSWGAYLDTPASARHVDTFRTNPAFRWHDYMPPPSGFTCDVDSHHLQGSAIGRCAQAG